eukprot:scaffold1023_cov313-Pinguiococcus_pyrenoidosus.AAC.36
MQVPTHLDQNIPAGVMHPSVAWDTCGRILSLIRRHDANHILAGASQSLERGAIPLTKRHLTGTFRQPCYSWSSRVEGAAGHAHSSAFDSGDFRALPYGQHGGLAHQGRPRRALQPCARILETSCSRGGGPPGRLRSLSKEEWGAGGAGRATGGQREEDSMGLARIFCLAEAEMFFNVSQKASGGGRMLHVEEKRQMDWVSRGSGLLPRKQEGREKQRGRRAVKEEGISVGDTGGICMKRASGPGRLQENEVGEARSAESADHSGLRIDALPRAAWAERRERAGEQLSPQLSAAAAGGASHVGRLGQVRQHPARGHQRAAVPQRPGAGSGSRREGRQGRPPPTARRPACGALAAAADQVHSAASAGEDLPRSAGLSRQPDGVG